MPHRRRPAHLITPVYEDNGLFKSPVKRVTVGLVPQMSRNNRQDLMVRGFVDPGIEISVVFAGRRARKAEHLEAHLRQLLYHAKAHAVTWDQAALDRTVLPVRVEGAWRPRFRRDTEGWETRYYHLIAARWALIDDTGMTHLFGEGPVRGAARPEARKAASGDGA
ncbi:MAG: hypothetical protein AAF727_06890 [Pseudomonadota bacterium]